LGYYAGADNTTGASNVFVGAGAGRLNTTASNSTAVGYQALYSSTNGSGANSAIGYKAGYADTTGNANVFHGYSAGSGVTTGSANVFVGYRAGEYITPTTTGSSNTLIGSYTFSSSATGAGAQALGHSIQTEAGYTTLGYAASDIRAANGSTTWSTVSDERYKKDIVDSEAGLSLINALRPRTFNYKTLGELPETFRAYEEGSTEVFKSSQTQHGFIAQEVKAAIDADSSIKDGFKLWDDREDGSQEVAEAALLPVLVKAIQDLSAKNDALEARIVTLEG
jgi:hypothetical protein